MIIGKRTEPIEERNNRHIKELKEDIELWESELNNTVNTMYKDHCSIMIEICEKTIRCLEEYSAKNSENELE